MTRWNPDYFYRDHPREYSSWSNMHNRCKSLKYAERHLYGGRGIRVCDRWALFVNFLADMGPVPTPKHSIDRINPDGHYEPGNCRWATPKEQGRTRRNSRSITFNGETLSLQEWSSRIGICRKALHFRIEAGWSIERALTTPRQEPGKYERKRAAA